MAALPPFHLAIPVHDLTTARHFYGEILGCSEGRSADTWVDFNFFGHQLVCHLDPKRDGPGDQISNPVDGHDVPVPHFGVVLEMEQWEALAEKLRGVGTEFIIEPCVRFAGEPGEQATMFLRDLCGNAVEFKAFRDIAGQLFAK